MELAQTSAGLKQQQQALGDQGDGEQAGRASAAGTGIGGGEGPAAVPAELEVGEGPPGGSCEGSPARSLTRSSTYTKLSDHAPRERSSCGRWVPHTQTHSQSCMKTHTE